MRIKSWIFYLKKKKVKRKKGNASPRSKKQVKIFTKSFSVVFTSNRRISCRTNLQEKLAKNYSISRFDIFVWKKFKLRTFTFDPFGSGSFRDKQLLDKLDDASSGGYPRYYDTRHVPRETERPRGRIGEWKKKEGEKERERERERKRKYTAVKIMWQEKGRHWVEKEGW